ncbi:MAG: hypothetical protein KIT20_04450 [Alphaproteobacteria bacterium]|nr:hypothetical protein [Alphaproteobacteria bacterium]
MLAVSLAAFVELTCPAVAADTPAKDLSYAFAQAAQTSMGRVIIPLREIHRQSPLDTLHSENHVVAARRMDCFAPDPTAEVGPLPLRGYTEKIHVDLAMEADAGIREKFRVAVAGRVALSQTITFELEKLRYEEVDSADAVRALLNSQNRQAQCFGGRKIIAQAIYLGVGQYKVESELRVTGEIDVQFINPLAAILKKWIPGFDRSDLLVDIHARGEPRKYRGDWLRLGELTRFAFTPLMVSKDDVERKLRRYWSGNSTVFESRKLVTLNVTKDGRLTQYINQEQLCGSARELAIAEELIQFYNGFSADREKGMVDFNPGSAEHVRYAAIIGMLQTAQRYCQLT